MVKPETLKLVAMHMYFKLDKLNAISRRFRKHHTLQYIEDLALEIIMEQQKAIDLMELM